MVIEIRQLLPKSYRCLAVTSLRLPLKLGCLEAALADGVGSDGVVGAGDDKGGDVVEGVDASAGSYGSAVEGGGGAGEFELAGERPVLEECVDEAGVEDVAGAGGVDYGDAEGWGVEELVAVPGEDSVLA